MLLATLRGEELHEEASFSKVSVSELNPRPR